MLPMIKTYIKRSDLGKMSKERGQSTGHLYLYSSVGSRIALRHYRDHGGQTPIQLLPHLHCGVQHVKVHKKSK